MSFPYRKQGAHHYTSLPALFPLVPRGLAARLALCMSEEKMILQGVEEEGAKMEARIPLQPIQFTPQ